MNQLILGDCLEVLKKTESESIDLIYLDPPFFSNRNYELIWGDAGEIRSFQDRWSGGIDHYIAWLKERVQEMHRVLKATGSIFLHCDWHADAYIRVLILDKVFGEQNCVNQIVWQRTTAHNNAHRLGNIHDIIWYYAKSKNRTFNPIPVNFSDEQRKRFKYKDSKGFYKCENLTAPATSKSLKRQFEWRGVNSGLNRTWAYSLEKLEDLYAQDKIALQNDGRPRKDGLKVYLDEVEQPKAQTIWSDLILAPTNKERIGYPTQKPEALLERIIRCATNEGDVVLDPFIGGGTTVVVAEKLNRQWIGIDQSEAAIKVSESRIQALQSDKS